LLSVPLCFADGGDDDRQLSKSSEGKDDVEFESRSKDSNDQSKVRFQIVTSDGEFETRVKYEGKAKDSDSKSEVLLQYRLELEQIVEFQDDNGNKQWDGGEEVSVINLDQKQLNWNDIVCMQNDDSWNCSASTTDGTVYCAVHLVGVLKPVSGDNVRPTSMKLDVHINKANKRSGTYIAVVFKVKAKEKMETKDVSTENQEGVTKKKEKEVSFAGSGFFSWVTEATVNGNTVQVLNSPLQPFDDNKLESGEACNRIVFVFDSTDSGPIVWDPKLGVNGSSFVAPSFFMMAVLLASFKLF